MREGHGKMTFASGDVYEGEFKEGKQEGHGKMTHVNGEVYDEVEEWYERWARQDDVCQWRRLRGRV